MNTSLLGQPSSASAVRLARTFGPGFTVKNIALLISDPAWWFTTVLVGLLVSVIAAFLRDWISRALASVSSRFRSRLEHQLAETSRLIAAMERTPHLLVIEYFRALYLLLASFALISLTFVLPAWQAFRRAYPDLVLTLAASGVDPMAEAKALLIAQVLLLLSGLYFLMRFFSRLELCEAARDSLLQHRA